MTRTIRLAHNQAKFNNIGFYLREMVVGRGRRADSEGFTLSMGAGRAIRLAPLLLSSSMLRQTMSLGGVGVVSASAETPASCRGSYSIYTCDQVRIFGEFFADIH